MVDIISKQLTKKGGFEVTFMLGNGEIYTVGFPTDKLYNQDHHVQFMITNSLPMEEEWEKVDFKKHLTERLTELLEKPLYIVPDKAQERYRIGSSIKKMRDNIGLDAKDLAIKSDMDAANLSRIEQGKLSTGIDTLSKIASALDATVEIVPSQCSIVRGADKKAVVHNFMLQLTQIDISKAAENTRFFGGAGIIVTDKPIEPVKNDSDQWYGYNDIYVVTPFAKELSWTIVQLRDIYGDNLDYMNKEEFYGNIAEAANKFIAADSNNLLGLLMTVIATALSFEF